MLLAFIVGAAVGLIGASITLLAIVIHTVMPGFMWSYLPKWLRDRL